ncbi:protein of unknown function [Pseudodesulfovibrio profundus]|uniref:Uncharacterized protein n=1 Tax=Pseudodesulfovibrio profundus TaxID=57320 RepID=A0A2C8F3P7_9BACT|nr:hypothetical protein [Pseudodesulfovibrio profundus]SOB56991.1 protein of unknown function [Pseudodesulfovibrio profundus]
MFIDLARSRCSAPPSALRAAPAGTGYAPQRLRRTASTEAQTRTQDSTLKWPISGPKDGGRRTFISDGPIKYLKELNNESIVVHSWVLSEKGDFESFDELPDLVEYLDVVSRERGKTQNFDVKAASHHLFIILELLRLVLLATDKDLVKLLENFDIYTDKKELKSRMMLLKHLGFVDVQHYQNRTFYVLKKSDYRYVRFVNIDDEEVFDAMRWSTEFGEYYQNNDKYRTKAYKKYLAKNGE